MSSSYVVTGACASLTTLVAGQPTKTLLYRGSLVPDSATEAEIEHNLACGLIGPVEVIADAAVVELLPPTVDGDVDVVLEEPAADAPEAVLEEPARNASTEDWKAFAIAKGAQPEDIDGLKRDELVELFGTPVGS